MVIYFVPIDFLKTTSYCDW